MNTYRVRSARRSTNPAADNKAIPETDRFLDVNDTTCERLGYSREELLSMGVTDLSTTASMSQADPSDPKEPL